MHKALIPMKISKILKIQDISFYKLIKNNLILLKINIQIKIKMLIEMLH